MTQSRTINKLTFFFYIFFVDVFSKNKEEEICIIDFKLFIVQKLLFNYFKFDDWLIVEVESVKL